jgi:uncharacterized membrane protein YccC
MSATTASATSAQLRPDGPSSSDAGRRHVQDWIDRLAGSDPGLNRLRMASQAVLAIGLALLAEYWFVHFTHALQIDTHGATLPAAQAAVVHAQHHGVLIVGMLVGAIVAMISSFGANDPVPRTQLITLVLVPIPMLAAMAVGLSIAPHRVIALASIAVVLAVGTYLRRFGPRGFLAGMLLFMGDFFGFFLHGEVFVHDLGWLAAEVGIGTLVALLVSFTVFYPHRRRALGRTQRSFAARARRVARVALEVFDGAAAPAAGGRHVRDPRAQRRLQRELVRLNEAALMIDAQLADPAALSANSSARILHQRLFDIELALTNLVRFSDSLASLDLTSARRAAVRDALEAVRFGNLERGELAARALLDLVEIEPAPAASTDARNVDVVARRFASSVIAYAEAGREWLAAGDRATSEETEEAFVPASLLFAGWLPGSAMVSAKASMESGPGRADKLKLAPYTRTAIQMLVAVSGAIALGDVLNGRRFYWAVIAAFITFMGANNAGEQIRKAALRVIGTVVGIMLGSLFVHLIGNDTAWSLVAILAALFAGLYLMRISYAFMVTGITIMVSQMYVQLDEFSNHLLVLRLEETALGAGVAILTVLVVLPLRTRHASTVAVREYVSALRTLVQRADQRLDGGAFRPSLRDEARAVDSAHQSLVTTVKPLQRSPFGAIDDDIAGLLQVASASRHYARDLVTDLSRCVQLDTQTGEDIHHALSVLEESLGELVSAGEDRTGEEKYTRSASLLVDAGRRLAADDTASGQTALLVVRDLQTLDSAMATLASLSKVEVTDLDTRLASAA